MSSFIINKDEYLKAAGFVSAMVETTTRLQESIFWLWNKRENRTYTADDVKKDFARLYKINFKAVYDGYHRTPRSEEFAPDTAEYTAEFDRYKAQGLTLVRKGYTLLQTTEKEKLRKAVYALTQFFDSVLYQIDDDKNQKSALKIMNKYYRKLYSILHHLDHNTTGDLQSWGKFNIFDGEDN